MRAITKRDVSYNVETDEYTCDGRTFVLGAGGSIYERGVDANLFVGCQNGRWARSAIAAICDRDYHLIADYTDE